MKGRKSGTLAADHPELRAEEMLRGESALAISRCRSLEASNSSSRILQFGGISGQRQDLDIRRKRNRGPEDTIPSGDINAALPLNRHFLAGTGIIMRSMRGSTSRHRGANSFTSIVSFSITQLIRLHSTLIGILYSRLVQLYPNRIFTGDQDLNPSSQ